MLAITLLGLDSSIAHTPWAFTVHRVFVGLGKDLRQLRTRHRLLPLMWQARKLWRPPHHWVPRLRMG